MRVSLALWPDRDVHGLIELAVAAEVAGFDDLWWPDHYDARECSAVLALCGLSTDRIRLGTAVTSVMLRHPAVLASMFATLFEATGGRILAGIGPGGFDVRTNLRTVPDKPILVVREAVSIIRRLLAGETVTTDGTPNFPMHEARMSFTPSGRLPIYLAARGLRMLELSGEVADGVITHGLSAEYLTVARERVKRGEAIAGRPSDSCDVTLMVEVALDDDLGRARETLRARSLVMAGGQYPDELVPLYGLNADEVGTLKEAVRARDPNAVRLVSDEMVDAFCLAGSPARVTGALSDLAANGISSFILSPGPGAEPEQIDQLGRLARQAAA
jgi:5,10-methylenetetrahydromethanopterin reductase